MKTLIYRLSVAFLAFLVGLLAAVVWYEQDSPHVEPVPLAPAPASPQPFNRAHVLSLCELADDPASYRGKEVLLSATHIGFLSSHRFSVLSECAGERAVSASINLAGRSEMPDELLSELGNLMQAHGEWADRVAGQVTISGRVVAEGQQVPSRDDFQIAATDVGVQVNPPASRR